MQKDMKALNVKEATKHPLATEEIQGMIEMISKLIEKDMLMTQTEQSITEQESSKIMVSFLRKI